MYDFSYALGTAVISHPALFNAVQAAGPQFEFVTRVVTDTHQNGPVDVRKPKSTGLLEENSTNAVRLAIATFLKGFAQAVPPVGLYTAGRFSQLLKIPLFNTADPASTFQNILVAANAAYTAALHGAARPALPAFPATLGLCLMDGGVQILISKFPNGFLPGEQAELTELLGEFGVAFGDPNFLVLQRFVNNANFKHAFELLMGPTSDQNPWDEDGTTLEQGLFWEGRSEHAIP
jgi:hypothetical protein